MDRRALRSVSIQVHARESSQFPRISAPTTFVIDLSNTGTEFRRFFLKRGIQYVRLDSPSDDAVFCARIQENLVNPGKWSNARCDALTTSVLAFSCPKPSTCAKRDTTLVNRHPSRLAFVEIQCATKFDQQVRCFGHSSLCFSITLGLTVPVFTAYIPTFFCCHGKHGLCTFREGHKHLL